MGNKKGYWAGNKNPKFKNGLTKLYPRSHTSWNGMMYRCYHPKSKLYPYYGGRGIKVEERWHHFENFVIDMGERPDGQSLERVDNNINYSKTNCIWATRLTQANNTRKNVMITHNGVTQSASQWSRTLGISVHTIFYRLNHGKPPLRQP